MLSFYSYQESSIHYSIQGKGETIVLLHGFLETLSIYDSITQQLSKAYQIIAIDLPGHGKSSLQTSENYISYSAKMIAQLLKELKIESVKIIGHSLGGYIALELLKEYPSIINGIQLFHSTAIGDTLEKKNNRNKAIELVREDKGKLLGMFIPNLFNPILVPKFEPEIKSLQKETQLVNASNMIQMMEAMRDRKDHRNTLKQFQGAKHYIIGKEDPILPCTELRAQASECNAYYSILEEAGHMGFIEEPKKTLEAIYKFLKL